MNQSRLIAGSIIVVYLAIRFGLESALDRISDYASLVFEVVFSLAAIAFYWSRFRFRMSVDRRLLVHGVSNFFLGWVTYRGTTWLGLTSPFDFRLWPMVGLLLVVAPLIEELLHRAALWYPCEVLFRDKPKRVIAATALLFAFGHFWAYFFVGPETKPFVLYQTAYTFGLSLWWGRMLLKYRSILSTVGLHFTFNLGFYLGFRIWG